MEMVLIKATSYDDMQEIAKHIKDRKVAVVNFEEMDKDIAQRMVDFLSGATFALDGVPRKVSGGTFIFSSSSVGMVGQIMDKNEEAAESPLDAEIRFAPNQWLRNK
ncbi:MAG: cell division protein SepF [Clostridiales bacterium]